MWKEMCKSRTEAGDRCVGWWLHSCIDGVIYIVEKEGLLADGSRCVGAPAKDALHTERVQGRGAAPQKEGSHEVRGLPTEGHVTGADRGWGKGGPKEVRGKGCDKGSLPDLTFPGSKHRNSAFLFENS